MLELDSWSEVLGAIVDGARPWSTPGEIAGALAADRGHVDVDGVLCELELHGMVDAWGPAYTLSAFAADGLGVRLVEYGLNRRQRWERGAPPRPRASPAWARDRGPDADRVPARYAGAGAGAGAGPIDGRLGWVVDPSPGPDEIAEANDEAEHWRPRGPVRVADLPPPSLVLSDCGGAAWTEAGAGARHPGPPGRSRPRRRARPPRGPCGVCEGRPLRRHVYCLSCDRWGSDGLAAARRRAALALAAARDAG